MTYGEKLDQQLQGNQPGRSRRVFSAIARPSPAEAVDVANVGASVYLGAAGIAGTFVAGTAAAAAVAGAGLGLPILALMTMAKSNYTKREDLHGKLSPLFHDPFDEGPRTPSYGDAEITKNSFALLEAKAFTQIKRQAEKLAQVKPNMRTWVNEIRGTEAYSPLSSSPEGQWPLRNDNSKKTYAKLLAMKLLSPDLNKPWLEYVRRMRHLSNYQQACNVVGKVKPAPNEPMPDIWANSQDRAFFKELSNIFDNLPTYLEMSAYA